MCSSSPDGSGHGRLGWMRAVVGRAWVVLGLSLACGNAARADELGAATYVRQDSDRTLVISPRAFAAASPLEPVRVEAVYAADAWTSASIDIRTGATQRVEETRHELDLLADWSAGPTTLAAGYRFSAEHDYESHGGTLELRRALAQNSAELSARVSALFDSISQVGLPTFNRRLRTVGARVGYYQVLTSTAWLQLTYELRQLDGYQASPYRSVGIGGSGLGCDGSTLCLRESVPERRTQHAAALSGRKALGEHFSSGGEYRFYVDDWGMQAHTVDTQLSWLVTPASTLALRYRYHHQGRADFYRARYAVLPSSGWLSRDRELSQLETHRIGLDATPPAILLSARAVLELGLSLGVVRFRYPDFVGLSSVTAGEISARASLTL